MEILIFLLGIAGGLFAGLVPGIGVFTTLILLYPLLLELTLTQLLILYIPLASISQFIGSVPALFFKIPGESTSFIATEYGHQLFLKGHHDLIPLTAMGSFVATILSAMIIFSLPYLYESMFYYFLSTKFIFFLILLTGACLVATSKNNWLVSTAMILLGMILGNVGFNASTGNFFGTFGNDWLSYGIPLFPFIVALYVLPNIMNLDTSMVTGKTIDNAYLKSMGNLKQYFTKMICGSFVGMITGFVPIIGKIVGVSASRALYKTSDKHSVIAAESSNNSSIFTAMIPLFLFGVPITLGEILIYNVAETNYDLQSEFKNILGTWLLPVIIVTSGLVGLVLSWPLARYCTYIFKLPVTILKTMFLAVVLASLLYIGFVKHMAWYYVFVLLAFLPLGYLLRNNDVIPLIFSFIFAKTSMTIFERMMI
jgi:putative tricarboxylic transport membrane protein